MLKTTVVAMEKSSVTRWPQVALKDQIKRIPELLQTKSGQVLSQIWETHTKSVLEGKHIVSFLKRTEALYGLWTIADVVQALRDRTRKSRIEEIHDARLLLLTLAFCFADKHIHEVAVFQGKSVRSARIEMSEELAAAIVASSWLNVPLDMTFNSDEGSARPLNLLLDHAPLEYGYNTIDLAVRSELQEFLWMYYPQIETRNKKSIMSFDNIQAGLKRLRQHKAIQPLFGIRRKGGSMESERQFREVLTDRYDIASFSFGSSKREGDGDVRDDYGNLVHQLADLQNNLLQHLRLSINPLLSKSDRTANLYGVRKSIFISYARADTAWKEQLDIHLKPIEFDGNAIFWSDKRIEVGSDWQTEIDRQLRSAAIAILLLSPDYLASEFVRNVELVEIMSLHHSDGLCIYPILIRPCNHDEHSLLRNLQVKQFKSSANKAYAFSLLELQDLDLAFLEVAKDINKLIKQPASRVENA